MKRMRWILLLTVAAALAGTAGLRAEGRPGRGGALPTAAAPPSGGAALDIGYCYDYLAPYGTWIGLAPHGYVWCPRHMGYRWRPYIDGYWIWTDWGWTWISDYDWGWMPFHYGRWGWDDDLGWFWVPGTVWGPAWVTWRWSDLYFGWAPIPPGLDFRAGIDFDALALGIPFNFWVFVGGSHFLDRDLGRYCLPYERNATIIGLTAPRNRFEFRGGRMANQGIDVETIRRITRRQVLRYDLADSDRPGGALVAGRSARIYQPGFAEDRAARPKEFLDQDQARRELAPAKVFEPRREAKPAKPDAAVRKRQAQERSLMLQSQAQERQDLERRRKEEGRAMKGADEKARSQQDYQARMAERQKQHQDEQQKMNQRHQQDRQQVRQSGPSKQQAPPPRKK
ncbi:MAG: DUF6600 domain-containing protein [Acidobacteriota bacterium]